MMRPASLRTSAVLLAVRPGATLWLMAALAVGGFFGSRCLCGFTGLEGVCGNGVVGIGEECDGANLDGETCKSRGYATGRLACQGCWFDESECRDAYCGDGIANQDWERCDGEDVAGATCADQGFFGGGVLRCDDTCRGYDALGCDPSQQCGNGVMEEGEVCDGSDLGGLDCAALGYAAGNLTCDPGCRWLEEWVCSGVPVCGNGVAEPGESCDGTDVRGTDCASAGFFDGGALGCTAGCQLDTGGCLGGCGNHRSEASEVCDGTDLGGLECPDFGYPNGALVCRPDCTEILVGACRTLDATCGNGILEPGETCDGTRLGFYEQCESLGFTSGVVACDPWCRIDLAACVGDACDGNGYYSNGRCDLCERWGGHPDPECSSMCPLTDGICSSHRDERLGVSTCLLATGTEDPDCGTCGDGELEPLLEQCDATRFAVGCDFPWFLGGEPGACTADCISDLTTCIPHRCGDGILCPFFSPTCTEQCDDGGTEPGDGCDPTCRIEPIIEVEPNDERTAATDVGPATWGEVLVEGEIAPAGDVDHFVVRLDQPGSVRVTVTGVDPAGCLDGTVNPAVRISGPGGIQIVAQNDDRDPGVDTCSAAEANWLDPGDYVIRVAASPFADPALTFLYRMTLVF